MKSDIARCTAVLLIPVMALLTACGNDADVDSAKTAESIEAMENVESENVFTEESQPSCGVNERSGQAKTEPEESEEMQPEGQNKIARPESVYFEKPIVQLNGRKGELGELIYNWSSKSIRIDEDTLLLVSDCYFPKEKLQQKIFFRMEAPNFTPREVFRQDSKIWDVEPTYPPLPYNLEERMQLPQLVDGGYVYELDGELYFLDEDFQEASLLCNLRELMGDSYSFSVVPYRTCDVTPDAAKMIICMYDGLYEYDLESGERKLLESAFFAHHDIVLEEGDCACGEFDFRFSGPVKVEYAPDGQSYAFLTGTEEANLGDITGAILRSGAGETLYQKKMGNREYMYDFKWIESEDTIYLAVFYIRHDEKNMEDVTYLMDRVDVNTGEAVTFEMPKEIYRGELCCIAGFLDEDTLLYFNYDKQEDGKGEEKNDKDIFEVYHLSTGERQDLEAAGDADWEMMVFVEDGYRTIPVRYPK